MFFALVSIMRTNVWLVKGEFWWRRDDVESQSDGVMQCRRYEHRLSNTVYNVNAVLGNYANKYKWNCWNTASLPYHV